MLSTRLANFRSVMANVDVNGFVTPDQAMACVYVDRKNIGVNFLVRSLKSM